MGNISEKFVKKNSNKPFLFNKLVYSRKIVPFLDNVRKYNHAGQAADDNIIRRMRFEWLTRKTKCAYAYSRVNLPAKQRSRTHGQTRTYVPTRAHTNTHM
jgi:hypothetical protein